MLSRLYNINRKDMRSPCKIKAFPFQELALRRVQSTGGRSMGDADDGETMEFSPASRAPWF